MKQLLFLLAINASTLSYANSVSSCKNDPSTSREIGEYYPEQILDLANIDGEVVGAITVNTVFDEIDGLILCGDNPNFFFGSGGSIEDVWNLKSLHGLSGLNRDTYYNKAYIIKGGSIDGNYSGESTYFNFHLTISPMNRSSFKPFSTGDLILEIKRDFMSRP